MHFYSHHIGDFNSATAMLTDHQAMTYLRLMWRYYDKEEPLSPDVERLARRVRSDRETVEFLLEEYFHLEDDGLWHHARCDRVIQEYQATIEKRRQAANRRWSNAGGKRAQSTSNASALHEQSKSNAEGMLSRIHNPETINQSKTGGTKRAAFTPPTVDEVRQEVERLGYNVDAETFVAFYESNGWMVGKNKMKSWKSALTTWQKNRSNQGQDQTKPKQRPRLK